MKQKESGQNKGKKLVTIIGSACILLGLILLGLKKIHRQEVPRDLKTEYEFNSGVTTHEKTYESTPTIYFPESMRQKGDYEINNKTGYQICVATPEEGFLFLEQGTYQIIGTPLVFFIVKPEGNEKKTYRGEVSICKKDEKTGFKYCIAGNGEKIKKMRFYTEII